MTDTTETIQNTSKTNSKLSKLDKAAVLVAKDNPNLNNYQIGKKLVSLGASTNHKSVADRWYKNDYLRRELQAVRDKNVSEIQRKLVPKSIIKLRKQLNNTDDKMQMAAINTTLKYGMGEMVNAPQQAINIGNIEKIQVAISQDVAAVMSSLDPPD